MEHASKRARITSSAPTLERLAASDAGLVTLDVLSSNLKDVDFGTLAKALEVNTCLTSLDMKWLGVGRTGGHALAEALKKNTALTEINACRNGFAQAGGMALGMALAGNSALKSLDMSLNDIGPEGGRAFGDGIAGNSALIDLNMSRTGLGPAGGKAMARALETNSTLASLDLTCDDVGMEGGKAFGAALAQNGSLTQLNMRWNCIGFGYSGSAAFAAGLRANATLTQLDMVMNELGDPGAIAFGEALQINRTLATLSLARNEIGAAGGASLADAIAVNTVLSDLDLSQNVLGSIGGSTLCTALANNRTLTSLNLSENALGPDGGASLGAALALNTSLVTLYAHKNAIGSAGGTAIAESLAQHPMLTRLDVSQNGLGADGAECGFALADALARNTALRHLSLEDNDIGVDDGAALGESIAAHPSLTVIDLSSNGLTGLPISCQLRLAAKTHLEIDLSNNPLSSPPLGRRADAEELREYLTLLLFESTAVTRIRLMVLGFGGVGKTTFCSAATWPTADLASFHGSLTPLTQWDARMVTAWMRGLKPQHEWADAAAVVLETNRTVGADLASLYEAQPDGDTAPSTKLVAMVGGAMTPAQLRKFARALASLMKKGYFSTVGAIKVEGVLPLAASTDGAEGRECSLVDFAGQMEARMLLRLEAPWASPNGCCAHPPCARALVLLWRSTWCHTSSSSRACTPSVWSSSLRGPLVCPPIAILAAGRTGSGSYVPLATGARALCSSRSRSSTV